MELSLIIVALAAMLLFCTSTRWMKNAIGHILGFGNCPNCGDTWWHNESECITYKESCGVMICKKCIVHPMQLDPEKIYNDLIQYNWALQDAKLAKQAVFNYKQGVVLDPFRSPQNNI